MQQLTLVKTQRDRWIQARGISAAYLALTGRTHSFCIALRTDKDFRFATNVKSVRLGYPSYYSKGENVCLHPDVAVDFIKTFPKDFARLMLHCFEYFIKDTKSRMSESVLVQKIDGQWQAARTESFPLPCR